MPIDPLTLTGQSSGGGTTIDTQISGLVAPDMSGGGLDLGFLKDLVKPRPAGRDWQSSGPAQVPQQEQEQWQMGVTPQGVQYEVNLKTGERRFSGGMPERFGHFVGEKAGM